METLVQLPEPIDNTKYAPEDLRPENFQPRLNEVLLFPLPRREKNAAGILIPDAVKDGGPRFAEVLGVGPGLESQKITDLQVGDIVVWRYQHGQPVTLSVGECWWVKSHDIYSKYEAK